MNNKLLVFLFLLFLVIVNVCLYRVYKYKLRVIVNPLVKQVLPPIVVGEREIKVILGGDVMLGRSVMTKSLSQNDPFYPFRKVSSLLQASDLTLVNLESPIVAGCPKTDSGMIFCTNDKLAEGLKFAGIDLVSLTNNHILNYGQEGLVQTKEFLKREKINFLEEGVLETKKVGDTNFGFLAFELVSKELTNKDLEKMSEADSKVDVLIVSVHWGAEYQAHPNKNQKEWGKKMVLAGADVVVGHHPHWVQDLDYIDGPTSPDRLRGASIPVFYSLGNLIFDQMWSEETKKGIVALLTFQGDKLRSVDITKVYFSRLGQPGVVQ